MDVSCCFFGSGGALLVLAVVVCLVGWLTSWLVSWLVGGFVCLLCVLSF